MSRLLSPEASSPIKRVKKVSNIKRHSSYEENRGSPLNSSDHRTANLVVSIAGFLTGSIKKERHLYTLMYQPENRMSYLQI